jgi:ERCC4-type nuclease
MHIDPRVGSVDLLAPLQNFGVPAELTRLAFGDVAFVGRGINEYPLCIGVELKETQDLIKSLQSSRFVGHQLHGLLDTYDRAWLLTEGTWRTTNEGVLMELTDFGWRSATAGNRQPVMTRSIEKQLLSITIRGGISHWHCQTRHDTIRFLSALYHWWTDKELSEHRSHEAIYHSPPDRAQMIAPSQFVTTISTLPAIGWEKSRAAEEHFHGSIRNAINATADEWQTVEGIGKGIATKIIDCLEAA